MDSSINRWALLTGIIQLLDYDLNINQTTNDEIMQHLELQDKMINKDIINYLVEITNQNKRIIELLTNEKCGGNDTNKGDTTI